MLEPEPQHDAALAETVPMFDTVLIRMHLILISPDIWLAGYPANHRAGCQISDEAGYPVRQDSGYLISVKAGFWISDIRQGWIPGIR
jgi:hypothetical protein